MVRVTDKPDLIFDPILHRYLLDGRQVPSVTGMLSDMGFTDNRWATEEHRDRGTAVHQLCAEIAMLERKDSEYEWDETSSSEVALPYGFSFQKFIRKVGFQIEPGMSEVSVGSRVLQCAGTFDMWGWVNGRRVMIDIKSGEPSPGAQIQLAGYRLLAREHYGIETDVSYALWLNKEGRMPKVVESDRPRHDESIFCSLAECWHWRNANKMLPKERTR